MGARRRLRSTDGRYILAEDFRIRFLLERDGETATIAWVQRTLRMYRTAVLDKNHYASTTTFRRGYIRSYCDFKRWLSEKQAYGATQSSPHGI